MEQDISKLLVEWKRHLSEAMAVFVRLPVYRRSSFLTLLEKGVHMISCGYGTLCSWLAFNCVCTVRLSTCKFC